MAAVAWESNEMAMKQPAVAEAFGEATTDLSGSAFVGS
jgi:hypothetical protein